MRARLAELGVPCPRNAVVDSVADVEAFGLPCVLKTTRGGYDGKGVWFVDGPEDCSAAFESAALETGATLLAEERVRFRRELSALVARSPSGQVAVQGRDRNFQMRRHVLHANLGVGKHRLCSSEFLRAEGLRPAACPAALAGGLETGVGALADDGAFELSECAKEMEH